MRRCWVEPFTFSSVLLSTASGVVSRIAGQSPSIRRAGTIGTGIAPLHDRADADDAIASDWEGPHVPAYGRRRAAESRTSRGLVLDVRFTQQNAAPFAGPPSRL